MKPSDAIYRLVTGHKYLRQVLTPIVGGLFFLMPINPPQELVAVLPYSRVRNPMLIGVFAVVFGLGFLLQSVSVVFVWMPLFVVLMAIELKLVEEPELERRLGTRYVEYRQRVPMFIPRMRGQR